ncbi:MAG: hypothetical protein IJO70_08255 [Lachnospiraceae bacterium]|nr:hypothetical protein [Lachnospiraceae bacterium]
MKDDNKDSSLWKECIIFGVVNILLVLLATKLNIMLISVAMILLIVAGVVVSAQYIKKEWNEGFKISAVGCVIGFLLHCGAGVLYVFSILMGIIGLFGY